MNDIEFQLRWFQPVGPPPSLRNRIFERQGGRPLITYGLLAASLLLAFIMYGMEWRERRDLLSSFSARNAFDWDVYNFTSEF